MQFEDSYFKNEVRDGFMIPGMIKRSWAMQIEILEQVAIVCKRHNLRWFADYGTLIGAVRHKGFVPWDDDLDICMFREDYERFYQIAKKELPPEYNMCCVEDTVDYYNFLLRITKGSSVELNPEYLRANHGFPYCAGIDVFPLDYLYEDEAKEKERCKKTDDMFEFAGMVTDDMSKSEKKRLIQKVEAHSGYRVDHSVPLFDAILRIIDQLYKEAPKEGAKRIAMMYFYALDGVQDRPIEYYENSIEIPFENGTICVPARYDEVLALEYGNWGVANRRGGLHDYPFFTSHEKILFEKNGSVPYRFEYTEISTKEVEKRENHFLACDQNANVLHTLRKVHCMIENLIYQEKWQDAMNLCSKCQELALLVGNNIEATHEQKPFEGQLTIVIELETYCEGIFQLYEMLERMDSCVAEKNNGLADICVHLEETYRFNHKEKKQILFLPVYSSDWKQFEPLYRDEISRAAEDKTIEIYVMPLPYFDRSDDGNVSTSHWDYASFPEELPLVDYQKVNLKQFHLEKIYITDPYDSYQSGMTVHPDYYSKNLYQICDELILVDCLDITNPLDEKTTENLKHYVLTPGVMRADQIVVPDEDTKSAFEKILKENKNGQVEKTILVDNRLFAEEETEKKSAETKNLLFFTSIADFYGEKNKIFQWLAGRVKTLSECKGRIKVFWPEPVELQESFLNDYPEYRDMYQQFIRDFKTECDGQVISEQEAENMIGSFDAFYGSPGYLLNQSARRKIPIMIRNLRC